MIPRSLFLVLVLVLLVVPGIVAADDSHPIWEKNFTDMPTMAKTAGKEVTIERFFAMNFCYDPNDSETVILLFGTGSLDGEGSWTYTIHFNDGSTVSGTMIRRWVSGIGPFPFHETDTELNGEWLNVTELLVQPQIQISYGSDSLGIWRLFARSGFAFINPVTAYPGGKPTDNPVVRWDLDGPGEATIEVWTAPYDDVKGVVDFVDDVVGETGWFGLISKLSGGIIDLILTVTGFVSYFTLADLPIVFFMMEGFMFMMCLGEADIFKTGEKWITMNSRLINGLLRVYEAIVTIISQAIGIFKP
jgi:hypothetical protein